MLYLNRQQSEIFKILKSSGKIGMNSYKWRMRFIQLPVRIKELKEKGFIIVSRNKDNRSVDYILVSNPNEKISLFDKEPKTSKYQEDNKQEFWVFKEGTAYQTSTNEKPAQKQLF